VVDQVVLPWRDFWWGGEVYTVLLARGLDVLPGTRQADDIRMEFAQVLFDHCWCISRRIASDKYRLKHVATLLLNHVDHLGHLVKLVRADIWAVRESEVDLMYITVSIV